MSFTSQLIQIQMTSRPWRRAPDIKIRQVTFDGNATHIKSEIYLYRFNICRKVLFKYFLAKLFYHFRMRQVTSDGIFLCSKCVTWLKSSDWKNCDCDAECDFSGFYRENITERNFCIWWKSTNNTKNFLLLQSDVRKKQIQLNIQCTNYSTVLQRMRIKLRNVELS